MDNQEYNRVVDEFFALLAEKGFTRDQAESHLAQLIELAVLRMQKELLEQSAVPKGSLTLSQFETFMSECGKKNPDLGSRLAKEFESALKEYLKAVYS